MSAATPTCFLLQKFPVSAKPFPSEEFQPKEDLSIFGSNEKPKQQDGSASPTGGAVWSGVVTDAVRNDQQNRRMTSFFNRFTGKSDLDVEAIEQDIENARDILESDSDDDHSQTALVTRRSPHTSPIPASGPSSVHAAPPLPPRNTPPANNPNMGESGEDQGIIEANMAFLESDEEESPRRATVGAAGGQVPSHAVNLAFASSRDPVTGGKFKAAARRALEASRRERELATKRGRGHLRERLSHESGRALETSEYKEFIQVKHPIMNTVCKEYGLTEGVAEAKYR